MGSNSYPDRHCSSGQLIFLAVCSAPYYLFRHNSRYKLREKMDFKKSFKIAFPPFIAAFSQICKEFPAQYLIGVLILDNEHPRVLSLSPGIYKSSDMEFQKFYNQLTQICYEICSVFIEMYLRFHICILPAPMLSKKVIYF